MNLFKSKSRFENALPLAFFTPGTHRRPILCYAFYTEVALAIFVRTTVYGQDGLASATGLATSTVAHDSEGFGDSIWAPLWQAA
jgi:hypothetical protein